jgi:hypothetical protein
MAFMRPRPVILAILSILAILGCTRQAPVRRGAGQSKQPPGREVFEPAKTRPSTAKRTCTVNSAVRWSRSPLEVLWAPEEQRLPRSVRGPNWTVLSFDMSGGELGASLRPSRSYRLGAIRWDTDPPHLYLRGAAAAHVGPVPSLRRHFSSHERCGWRASVEFEGSPVEIYSRCDSGRHIVESCWGGSGARLFDGVDAPDLYSGATWLADWDHDGHLELLIEVSHRSNDPAGYVGLYRLGSAEAELLGEDRRDLENHVEP